MNPNWGQKQTQTRSTATKNKSDTKETYKETFKERETPPPDELSLEKSSSLHCSRKDNSTPTGSCESLQPYPFEDDDIDAEDLPPVDWEPGDTGGDAAGGEGNVAPGEFEAEAHQLVREFSELELRGQYTQCIEQDDPQAPSWGRALDIKLAREETCQQ